MSRTTTSDARHAPGISSAADLTDGAMGIGQLAGCPRPAVDLPTPDDGRAARENGGAGVVNRPIWPRMGTTAAIGIGVTASLTPGLLPRTAEAQAVVTGLLVAVALGGAGLIRFMLRRRGVNAENTRGRRVFLLVAMLLIMVAAWYAGSWQNTLRAAMDTAPIGPGYWLRCAVIATVLVLLLRGIGQGIRWVLRRLRWARSTALVMVVGTVGYFGVVPTVVDYQLGVYANANAAVDPELVRPVSVTRSGSAASMVDWSTLGREGRRFVTGAPVGPVRVYIGLDSASDLDSRVRLAIQELQRAGGFARSHLVVAVPTGSGWIDANAVRGFDERFGGDVALVGLQYSYAPSWATFVFGREAAVTSARALFTAIERYIAGLEHPPRLYLYGQSLGALGGSAVFTDDADQDRRTCAVLWAGPPAGAVHRSGAVVLANTSDPVVHWSPALFWRAPDLSGARVDAPVPGWIPVLSFVQTTADLLYALDAPPGHGHRYGTDQGTVLPGC
ncbi:alpha/beta-hydrolase family protein [Nocardia donostiensis]|uniref:alpha/beta-hydrolase family protein n=1 Tax=Nocardia donostiensis TaxID=1538463 RepID=UPI0020CA76F5|nr:alpha/beta-hydrolase family protein [Nocardia donostiensis]